jgi:hypothetical protein
MYSEGKIRKFKKSRNEDNAQKLPASSQEPFSLLFLYVRMKLCSYFSDFIYVWINWLDGTGPFFGKWKVQQFSSSGIVSPFMELEGSLQYYWNPPIDPVVSQII